MVSNCLDRTPVFTRGPDPENGFLSGQKNIPTLVDLGFEGFRSLRFKKGFFGPNFFPNPGSGLPSY